MSQENVETIRQTYEAFSRGDFVAASKLAHPEIVLVPPGGQSPLKGGAVRAWMEPDAIAEQRSEPRGFRVNGDRILVHQHTWSRGAGSGIEMEADFWALWTFDEDGLVTRIEIFLGHQEEEALEAAGL